jgi:hypothetical protein
MDSYPREREQNWKGYYVPAHSFPMVPDVLSPANFTTSSNLVIPPGSESRARNLSNSSSLSSWASYTSSPVDFDYENNMDISPALTPMNLDSQHLETGLSGMPLTSAVESGLGNRHTPKILGWTNDTPFAKLYEFRVPKGKEPYLELLPNWTVTFETPRRVYLDKPEYYSSLAIIFRRLIVDTLRNPQKNKFPCQYPGPCPNRSNVFSRPADLERHYKLVHAPDQKGIFSCDYRKCARSKDAFTRKDHYRDHLRDYHKEDIGSAKMDKKAKNNKEEYAKLQQDWLKERNTRPGSWRCGRCLVKVDVRIHGWDCPECKTSCEEDRVKARQLLAMERGKEEREETYGQSVGMALEQNEYYSYPGSTACSVCNGSEWIEDVYGGWQPCAHAHTQVYYL